MGCVDGRVVWWSILVVFLIGLSIAKAQDTSSTTTNTPEPALDWYECPDQYSYHPHPQNCTLYIICVFGKAYLRWCEGGLNWNEQLKICDWPNKKTTCMQVDANTAYRPQASPAVTAPSFPQHSESETAMLNFGDPNEMPNSFQKFSPDEDAAKSQLTQFAGKKVVYYNKDLAGPPRETADPSLQQDGSQQYDKYSRQEMSRPQSANSQSRPDSLQPVVQLRDPGMPVARGPPQKMSSWDTGNDDFPPQNVNANEAMSNDREPSRSQQPPAPPPKISPPSSSQPAGNPPPWLAMALQKKVKAPSAEQFRMKARGPPGQSTADNQRNGPGDQRPMSDMNRASPSDMDQQSVSRPEATAPADQLRSGPPSDQLRRVAPLRSSPQQPSRDSNQFSPSPDSIKPQSYPGYPSSSEESSPPQRQNPSSVSPNSDRRYQQMYQGPVRGSNEDQSQKKSFMAAPMNRGPPQDVQQGSRSSPQSMSRPSPVNPGSDRQLRPSEDGPSRPTSDQSRQSFNSFPPQSSQPSRSQNNGRPVQPSSSDQDQMPSNQDLPQRRDRPNSGSSSGSFGGRTRESQVRSSSQQTQSDQRATASENLWNQLRGQGEDASDDSRQQPPPPQSRAPPTLRGEGSNVQRSQNPIASPSLIRSPFGFGGQQDFRTGSSKGSPSSDNEEENGPIPTGSMGSGLSPQPQGFKMPTGQGGISSSRGRAPSEPKSEHLSEANNAQSVNTPSRGSADGFADGSPVQDRINRMRQRFPSFSEDDQFQGSRQPARQQGPSLEDTVNRWSGFDADQGGSQQQPIRSSSSVRFTGDDNGPQSSAASDYDIQRFYVGV